jgi:hypothetical protein
MMSHCDRSKALQVLAQRQTQQRIREISNLFTRRLNQFAAQHNMPQPARVGAAAAIVNGEQGDLPIVPQGLYRWTEVLA